MNRTLDHENPEDRERIQLIVDILKAEHGANSMSTQLNLVKHYEKCPARPFEGCMKCD